MNLKKPEEWKVKGNEYYDKGEYDKAIECFQKAIEINPDFTEAHNNIKLTYKNKAKNN